MNCPGRIGSKSRLVDSLQQPIEVVARPVIEKDDDGVDGAQADVYVRGTRVREAQMADIDARKNILKANKYANRPILRRLY